MGVIGRLVMCTLAAVMVCGCDSVSEKVEQTGTTAQGPQESHTVEPRVLKFGTVTAYLDERLVEVDVEICLEEGILEYLAVAEDGKAYESVMVILCEPSDLHMALLAIGCEPGDVPKEAKGDFIEESVGQTDEKAESRLNLFLEWTEQGKPVLIRAEELLFSIDKEQALKQTHWTFTGSYFTEDAEGQQCYAADIYRSVIAVWYDPSAVINLPVAVGNPYRGPSGFSVNTAVLPKGERIRLVILPGRSDVKPSHTPGTK